MPTQIMSPVVVASWITERSGDGVERLQLLVLWRGTPGWFLPEGGSGVSGGGSGDRYHATITEGDLQLTLDYDSSRRVATVHGKTIDISKDNVVFVDEVDSPTGPRVTGTMRVERAMPGSAGQIALVLRTSPEIMSFLRCEATTTDPAEARGAGTALPGEHRDTQVSESCGLTSRCSRRAARARGLIRNQGIAARG